MKLLFRLFLVHLLLASPLSLQGAEQMENGTVEAILFDQQEDAEYVRIRMSGAVQPVIFQLPGDNPRVVCDLPEVAYPPTMKKVIPAGGELVRRIRVGIHHRPEPKTRVVVDLAKKGDYTVDHHFEDYVLTLKIAEKTTRMKPDLVGKKPLPDMEEAAVLERRETPVADGAEGDGADGTERRESAGEGDDDAMKKVETRAGGEAEKDMEKQQIDEGEAAPAAVKGEVTQQQKDEVLAAEEGVAMEEEEDVKEFEAAPSGEAEAKAQPEIEPSPALPGGRLRLGLEDGAGETIDEEQLPVIHDISYEKSSSAKEMVLFRLSGFYPPVVFSAEGDDLLVVCDFLEATLGYGIEPVLETGGEYIKRVTISKQTEPDKVRVVLDLADDREYDLKQVFFKDDNLFVVVINSTGMK